ncbi:MAG TPA: 3-keto-5-aminohexanoate cleavage protein [Actinopolymorphaceae bacterium]
MDRVLVCALNGGRAGHPGVPVTSDELAADAVRVVATGATEVHVHPRRRDGSESLDPDDVARVVEAIGSAAPGVPVSVTTAQWIEADPRRRVALVSQWPVLPAYALVNAHEEGAVEVAHVLRERGVAVEAGLFTVLAAELFVRTPLRKLASRVVIEPVDRPSLLAMEDANRILAMLDRYDVGLPRILHGDGPNAWPLLRRACQLGLGMRIGFEDTLVLPDGSYAPHNVALVQAALVVAQSSPGASQR